MRGRSGKLLLGACAAVFAGATCGPAIAQGAGSSASGAELKQIGTLTCTASAPSGDSQVPEKETQFACTFEPAGTEGVKEYYVGTSPEQRREIGPAAKTLMAWSVHTAGKPASPGTLEGAYKLTTTGDDGRSLTGGVENAYTLRPLTTPDAQSAASAPLNSLVLRRDRPRV